MPGACHSWEPNPIFLWSLLCSPPRPGSKMSTEAQRVDDSPSTSGGSSDGDQRESVQQEPEREQVQPKKKEGKISSKTAAKLSTSAKRIQKELAEITLDPPPNCRSFNPWSVYWLQGVHEPPSEMICKIVCLLVSIWGSIFGFDEILSDPLKDKELFFFWICFSFSILMV
ncbi:uncharacterized protein LOC100669970 isoform X2 [Loxodonta africana]|uniref:uncharacterized protein LOC100669970 isoform X2 n=1 Tax=Loxodonta africana TaxID=9785 RepID=UPI000C8123D9|nr:uncharacterized protein LOC100669970 isoform X2 [Loxodonta africana]